MSIEDDVALLERVATLRLLGTTALRMLAIGSEQRDFRRGELLFTAGEEADAGFIVQRGSFRISDDNGAETIALADLVNKPCILLSQTTAMRGTIDAAMEALGATRSGLQADVTLLAASELLHHPSRDVQVTDVRALRNLCSPNLCSPDTCQKAANAVRPLRTNADTQVDDAVNRALADLARCAQP